MTCGDFEGLGVDRCYLDCSAGQTCPDGQACVNGQACGWPSSSASGAYEACDAETIVCEDGAICFIDGIPATLGACVTAGCNSAADCPAGPPGTTTACSDLSPILFGNECYLECAVDADCPAGASCYVETLCVYPVSG